MAEHETTPRDIERSVGERQRANVRGRDLMLGARLCQHLDGEVDADGHRRITRAETARRAASDVEQ